MGRWLRGRDPPPRSWSGPPEGVEWGSVKQPVKQSNILARFLLAPSCSTPLLLPRPGVVRPPLALLDPCCVRTTLVPRETPYPIPALRSFSGQYVSTG